jgi:hypothetical protein
MFDPNLRHRMALSSTTSSPLRISAAQYGAR